MNLTSPPTLTLSIPCDPSRFPHTLKEHYGPDIAPTLTFSTPCDASRSPHTLKEQYGPDIPPYLNALCPL